MIAYSTKTRDGTVRLYHYGRLVALISETTLAEVELTERSTVADEDMIIGTGEAWAYQGVGWRGAGWNGTASSATIAAMKGHQELEKAWWKRW